MALSRDDLLKLSDTQVRRVQILDWGEVCLRTITAGERLTFDELHERDKGEAVLAMVTMSLSDADGNPLLKYPDDVEIIRSKGAKAIALLYLQAAKLNAITAEDLDELKKTTAETDLTDL